MLTRILQRLKRIKYKRAISSQSIEARFHSIYKKGLWDSRGQSRSGAGSTLEATVSIRKWLPELLKQVNAATLVDLGCGDYYWMKEIKLPCRYIGLDIVGSVIAENQTKYADSKHEFFHHNAVEETLPEDTDVVLCREVLFHLSFADGLKLINNVLNSNARYLLVTTSEGIDQNRDIRTGEFRNINLQRPPYNFPAYESKIKDSETVSSDRYLGVWELAVIKNKGAS